jgi:hypothetical protein
VAFLNIRGLGKPGRRQALTDFIVGNKVDFIGIQETKQETIDDDFLLIFLVLLCLLGLVYLLRRLLEVS